MRTLQRIIIAIQIDSIKTVIYITTILNPRVMSSQFTQTLCYKYTDNNNTSKKVIEFILDSYFHHFY